MSDKTYTKRTIYLSRSERSRGGRLFLRFTALNGLSYSFMGEAVVSLLAIHFGAGNLELGIIAAMIHISGIALLVIPRIFRGRNVVSVGFWTWMIRGFVSLPYLALYYMEGRNAVALIMTLYALFSLARTSGLSMVITVQKRLMIRRTQNDVIFRTSMSFQGTSIISRCIGYLVLSLKSLAELSGLLILPVLGVLANTAAAFAFRRIPNRTKVDYVKGENLLVILGRALRIPRSRRVLFLRWISLGQLILFAMVVPFLRRAVGLDTARIFLYTIALGLAAFFSSVILRPIAIRAGSRPLLFYTALPSILFFLIWTFIPPDFGVEIYAIVGFITMFFLNTTILAANQLLVDITPDDGAVGFNSMDIFVISILAIFIGFGAGYLADLSSALTPILPINTFGLVFVPAAIGAIFQVLLILKVDEPGSLGLIQAAQIISNLANLRTWQTVSDLEKTADPVKRKTLIHSMGHSRAPVASLEIGKILSEPLSQEKGELIDALFLTRRPELAEYLCDEAAAPEAFHRKKAIFALGAYPGARTEEVLVQLLSDEDPGVRCAAAKSLGRIGAKDHLETVERLWFETENLHQRLDLMIALFHMDEDRRYLKDVFSTRITRSGERAERTIFTLLSLQFGMSPPLGYLYREESVSPGEGFGILLEEARDTNFLLKQSTELVELWQSGDHQKIWDLCQRALTDVEPPLEADMIRQALLQFPRESTDKVNALAALYFTYQIFTAEADS